MRTVTAVGLLVVGSTVGANQNAPEQIPLWPNGAPGFESRRAEPEVARDYWVKNIHNPSITVFLPPAERATGAGVVICPGGGHRELVFKAEGEETANFFNSIGVAAFALKYRLAREDNSPYKLPKHPREDAYRALRLVRSRADEWNIDPKRVGIIGFSAGGEVASFVAYGSGRGNPKAPDPIDRLSGRPDFQILGVSRAARRPKGGAAGCAPGISLRCRRRPVLRRSGHVPAAEIQGSESAGGGPHRDEGGTRVQHGSPGVDAVPEDVAGATGRLDGGRGTAESGR
jgi:hypothetical protein